MPHHGRSSWPEEFDYVDVADRVARLLDGDDPVTLVGHSMGGKAAMTLALRHPTSSRGCASWTSRRWTTADGLGVRGVHRRDAAHGPARHHDPGRGRRGARRRVPNTTVRAFLLQNLRRDGDGWRWQANLDVLGRDLPVLGGWPAEQLDGTPPYEGPVLWVAGATSAYVTDEYAEVMQGYFPRVRRVTIKDAGHWVHLSSRRPSSRCCAASSARSPGRACRAGAAGGGSAGAARLVRLHQGQVGWCPARPSARSVVRDPGAGSDVASQWRR